MTRVLTLLAACGVFALMAFTALNQAAQIVV